MMTLFRRVIWWLRQRRKEEQLREELAFHLEQETRERRGDGLPEDEALWAAHRDLGNEARVREEVRALWTWRPLDELSQDLLVVQTALLMLLLVGAGLFAQTLSNLQSVPLGFNPESVLLFDVNAPQAGQPESRVAAFYADLRQRLAELPGVRAATQSHASLIRAGRGHPVAIDGMRAEDTRFLQPSGLRLAEERGETPDEP